MGTPCSVRPAGAGTRWFASLALLCGAAACGGGDGGPKPAASIAVSPAAVSLTGADATSTVSAVVRDAAGNLLSAAPLSWSSDAPSVATVSASGSSGSSATITSRDAGATVVRARSGAAIATVAVRVLGVRAIAVLPLVSALRVGSTQALTATVDADEGVSGTVTWASSNVATATVSASGVVTGTGIGSALVRATSVADSRVSASVAVNVSAQRVVTITPATSSLVAGQQLPLVAAVTIEPGLSTAVEWRTGAGAIATVSAQGVVTAVANGTTTVTAIAVADSLARATATITVVPSVRTVSVAPAAVSLFLGASRQLTGTVVVDGALPTGVQWRSSQPSIANVSNNGTVTGVAVGSATIVAVSVADSTKRASASVTVESRPTSIAIVQRNVGLNPATQTTLTATVLADPGIPTAVDWTSSATTVASIDASGVARAIAPGQTIITATVQADASKRDTVTLSVVPALSPTWTPGRVSGPLFEDVVSTVAFGTTSTFAVNFLGDIFSYNGNTFTVAVRGATYGTRFTAIHGSSSDNVIAVGTNGVILQWNGTQWFPMASGTTRTLTSVHVESPSIAFAVGLEGTALRLAGGAWAVTTTPSAADLFGVWSFGSTAIAVGAASTALQFDGSGWVALQLPTSETLNAISGTAPDNIYVVGSVATVVHFDGTSWSIIGSSGFSGELWAIRPTIGGTGRMLVAGDGGLLQLDGTTLTRIPTPYAARLYDVSVEASGAIWAVGERGLVYRSALSGGGLQTLNLAPDLLDVWSTAANNAWAVGEFGFIYSWGGTSWARQSSPTTAALNSVWASGSNDAFAGGDQATMLRWNGGSWSTMGIPTNANVTAIWGSGSNNVYATTDVGEILRFDGTMWRVVATAASPLWSIFGASANAIVAGGDGGTMLYFDGTSWQTFAPPANGGIAGVWLTGLADVLVVGTDGIGTGGLSYRFTDTNWQVLSFASSAVFSSVWGASLTDLYVTGDAGTLLRFNGTVVLPVFTGVSELLWSVTAAPSATGAAFAVGYNAMILTSGGAGIPTLAATSVPSRGALDPARSARRARISGISRVGTARAVGMRAAGMKSAGRRSADRQSVATRPDQLRGPRKGMPRGVMR